MEYIIKRKLNLFGVTNIIKFYYNVKITEDLRIKTLYHKYIVMSTTILNYFTHYYISLSNIHSKYNARQRPVLLRILLATDIYS